MSRQSVAAALLLASAVSAAAQVRITGVVAEAGGSATLTPVPEAFVLAKSGSPPRAIAEAVTDSRGRYALAGLPAGRVSLSIEAQGYYTVKAGDLEADSITRSCPQAGDCGETNFEIARAAVVEGWLTDPYGDPLQDAQISLTPESSAGISDPMERMRLATGRAVSDDRGYFRIWGVKPGRYELTAQQRMPYQPGGQGAEEKRSIEIAPGETHVETRFSIRSSDVEVFSISGEVTGLPEENRNRTGISIQPVGEGAGSWGWTRFESLNEGKFTIPYLTRGQYALRAAQFDQNGRNWIYLDTLTVDRDLTDLRLSAKPPTGIRGRVEFVDSPAANQVFRLRAAGRLDFSTDAVEAKAPDDAFEHAGLAPGDYEATLLQPDYYFVDPPKISVVVGRLQELTLRVSNQRATVRGVARLASGETREAAAHFTVALRGERVSHKVQADDSGGFTFEKVIPGDYEIAAWASPNRNVEDEEAWRQAGDNVKKLTVEPGFETEVDLTVTR